MSNDSNASISFSIIKTILNVRNNLHSICSCLIFTMICHSDELQVNHLGLWPLWVICCTSELQIVIYEATTNHGKKIIS